MSAASNRALGGAASGNVNNVNSPDTAITPLTTLQSHLPNNSGSGIPICLRIRPNVPSAPTCTEYLLRVTSGPTYTGHLTPLSTKHPNPPVWS